MEDNSKDNPGNFFTGHKKGEASASSVSDDNNVANDNQVNGKSDASAGEMPKMPGVVSDSIASDNKTSSNQSRINGAMPGAKVNDNLEKKDSLDDDKKSPDDKTKDGQKNLIYNDKSKNPSNSKNANANANATKKSMPRENSINKPGGPGDIASAVGNKAKQGIKKVGEKLGNIGKDPTDDNSGENGDDSDPNNEKEIKQTAGNAAKTAGHVVGTGLKALWRIIPLPAKLVIIGILLILLLIFLVIFVLFSGGSSKNGGGSFNGTYNACNSASGSSIDASALTFIDAFEGGQTCTTSDGLEGWEVLDVPSDPGGATGGHGITHGTLEGSTAAANLISSKNYGGYFRSFGTNGYTYEEGDCIPKFIMDEIEMALLPSFFEPIINLQNSYNATHPDKQISFTDYQLMALLSFTWNSGIGATRGAVNGYGDNGYQGLWNYIGFYLDGNGGQTSSGLLARRKAEFALFVTGDYSDGGKFYNRHFSNYSYGSDYSDYNSEGVLEREGQGSSAGSYSSELCAPGLTSTEGLTDMNGFKVRTERPLYGNSFFDAAGSSCPFQCVWYARNRGMEVVASLGLPQSAVKAVRDTSGNGNEWTRSNSVLANNFNGDSSCRNIKAPAIISVSGSSASYGHVAILEAYDEANGKIYISEGWDANSGGSCYSGSINESVWSNHLGFRAQWWDKDVLYNDSYWYCYGMTYLSEYKGGN